MPLGPASILRRLRGPGEWSPSLLFAAGEQGFWYDPTDIPVNWRRNLLTYSEQLDNAAWLKVAIGTGSAPVVTPNAAVAPDGTTTAELIVFNRGAGNTVSDQSYVIQLITPPSVAEAYTFSVWLKAATGGDVGKQLALRTVGGSPYGVITLTANWVRYSRTEVGSSNNGGEINTRGTVTVDNSVSAHVWGAQLERASTASDYQRIVTPEISFLDYQPQPVMYTDSAGTTPVAGVEQAVGLILDKSKGLVLGPELVTNGNFSNGTTGWTITGAWAESGGQFVKTGGSTATASQAILTIGKTYRITVDVVAVSTNVLIYAGSGNAQTVTTPGTKTFTVVCLGDTNLYVQCLTAATATIDNISVRELAGNHAIQPGATNRPILRSRYNQFTFSEDITNAAWTKSGITVTGNAGIAPDGTTTADRMTAGSVGYYLQSTGTLNGTNMPVTATIRIKNEDYTASDTLYVNVSDGITGFMSITFKPSDGTFTAPAVAASWSNVTRTVTNIGSGWWLLTLSGTTSQWGGGWMEVGVTAAHNRSCLVWGHDLRRTIDTYLPYQRIGASTDYDTVGFPVYLSFDGSDDSLYTGGNVDFSATDKMTVFAGVTRLGTADGMLAETSTDAGTTNGSFFVYGIPTANYGFARKGTSSAIRTDTTGVSVPATSVLTYGVDLSATIEVTAQRVDGADSGSVGSADTGSGNFGSYPLYIGRRNNTNLPFNGRLYNLIGRGAATPTSISRITELWLAGTQKRQQILLATSPGAPWAVLDSSGTYYLINAVATSSDGTFYVVSPVVRDSSDTPYTPV